jgi:protein-histidine pros-kinase
MSTILAIDDKKDNLTALRALLKNVKPDDEIITALSGQEGMDKAVEMLPDVILLDISMPGMDGFEVCSQLKCMPETKHIPIILVTAYHTDAKSHVYGFEQGADAFLSKPIDEGELVAQVNAMLRLKSAEDRLRSANSELERRVRERTSDLERSQKDYQRLFDFAPDMYFTLDAENRIIAVNQFGARYLGFSKDDLADRPFVECVPETDRIEVQSLIEKARVGSAGKIAAPFRLRKSDGDAIWVTLRTNFPKIIGSEQSDLLLILHDVTEEQAVLDALHESEEQLRTLYNNLNIGIYRSTLDGKVLFANPALLQMMQCDTLMELQQSDLQEQFAYNRNEFERIIAEHNSVRGFETRIRRKDGTWIDIRESAVTAPDAQGRIQYYEGTIEDITEKVEAERELLASERRFRMVAEAAKDAILGFDDAGNLLLWNRAAATLFLFDSGASRSRSCTTLFSGITRDMLFKYAAAPRGESEGGSVLDLTCRRCDGSSFPAALTLSEIQSQDKIKVFAIVRDISERIENEKAREAALQLAQEALRVKSLFIANMSHEIRTPLNSMLGFIILLQDNLAGSLDAEQQEYFQIVHESGARLLTTVHHILDLSRIEAGGVRDQRESFDLVPLVQATMKELQPAFLEKGLSSSLVSEGTEILVHADRFMLSQSLMNILENAIKYSERGGIIVHVDKNETEAFISVKDTGIGISQDFFPKLFSAFSQESEGYTKKFQGLGLGLALAKRYTEMNDGRIDVKSTKGKGSTFTVFLPLQDTAGMMIESTDQRERRR